MLKIDRYYDVSCDYCGRNMSTDFEKNGMALSSKQAQAWARRIGFRTKQGKNICPLCLKELEKGKGDNGKI